MYHDEQFNCPAIWGQLLDMAWYEAYKMNALYMVQSKYTDPNNACSKKPASK